MFTDIASHHTSKSVYSLTLLPITLENLYVHWHYFPFYWHFCMFTDISSNLTGTSVFSLTFLHILLALLCVHWHYFPFYWHFSMFTDISSNLTGTSVCSLTLLHISLTFIYVHLHCFPSYWYICMFTDIASHPTGKSVDLLTLLLILLALLYVNWHYFRSYDLPPLYSQKRYVRNEWFWQVWWQHVRKWNVDSCFWYAAKAWSGCCLYACYDVFIKAWCGGLHCTGGGNEVLPCVQVQFSAVSFLSSTWLYYIILIAWVRPEPSLVYCFDNCTL